ncbi:MAG: hypothetical protein QXN24_04865 [Candidatus Bathyarchaeia archaeon]|nr:hypothetical protein [Candidatus Bathyarchaeota archaeon]
MGGEIVAKAPLSGAFLTSQTVMVIMAIEAELRAASKIMSEWDQTQPIEASLNI